MKMLGMSDRKYNCIYDKLVGTDNDLVGLVAYGLYKKHKIEFITNIKETSNREPTDEECNAFFIASTADSQILKYRRDAEDLISEIVVGSAEEESRKYEIDMLHDYQRSIRNVLPSDLKSVFLSIIGAFAFSLIAGIFYFIGGTSEKAIQDNTLKVLEVAKPYIQKEDTISFFREQLKFSD